MIYTQLQVKDSFGEVHEFNECRAEKEGNDTVVFNSEENPIAVFGNSCYWVHSRNIVLTPKSELEPYPEELEEDTEEGQRLYDEGISLAAKGILRVAAGFYAFPSKPEKQPSKDLTNAMRSWYESRHGVKEGDK